MLFSFYNKVNMNLSHFLKQTSINFACTSICIEKILNGTDCQTILVILTSKHESQNLYTRQCPDSLLNNSCKKVVYNKTQATNVYHKIQTLHISKGLQFQLAMLSKHFQFHQHDHDMTIEDQILHFVRSLWSRQNALNLTCETILNAKTGVYGDNNAMLNTLQVYINNSLKGKH